MQDYAQEGKKWQSYRTERVLSGCLKRGCMVLAMQRLLMESHLAKRVHNLQLEVGIRHTPVFSRVIL